MYRYGIVSDLWCSLCSFNIYVYVPEDCTLALCQLTRYQVKFDDGDSRYVRHSEALLIERLPLGQPVMVQSQDGYFDAGLIVGQVKKGGVFQYSVEKDSGETRT